MEAQEAATDEGQDGQTQQVIANISAEDWQGGARNRRGEIPDAAEAGGAAAVAEVVSRAVAEAPGATWGGRRPDAAEGVQEAPGGALQEAKEVKPERGRKRRPCEGENRRLERIR